MDLEAESAIQVDTAVSLDIAQSCNKLLETQKKMAAIDEQLKNFELVVRYEDFSNILYFLLIQYQNHCKQYYLDYYKQNFLFQFH